MTSARWKVLGALFSSNHPLTVPDVARMMGQSRQVVQRLFNETQQEGLLDTLVNPNYKRAKFLVLTDKGKMVCTQLDEIQVLWVNSMSSEFTQAELETSSLVLRKFISLLEAK